MPEVEHTPPPWKHRIWDWGTFEDANGKPILKVYQRMPATPAADLETMANRRLVEAAPELLKELEEAVKVIRVFHGRGGWEEYQSSPEMQRINAALAKARGES